MANQAYPSLNGIAPSWADISVTITPEQGSILDVFDIAAAKWNRKLEVGEQRGASGGRVMKRTSGQGSQDASITLYRDGYITFLDAIRAAAPTRGNQQLIGQVSFDILIQHTPPGSTQIFQTKIKGCRLINDSDDMKEGSDPDQIECALSVIEIVNITSDGKETVLV